MWTFIELAAIALLAVSALTWGFCWALGLDNRAEKEP